MDVTPLISVVVPIYNVALYVRKCLDSLKKQTMKEIEIICIDDGSTDGSGAIAEEFESDEFPLFRVIHTENHGLSAARNRGIKEARADWLMFVDSDDWVHEDFCRVPYETAIKNQADMVIFNWLRYKKGHLKNNTRKQIRCARIRHISREIAVDSGCTVAWNKIYKKALFRDVLYPDNHVYEDVATTHQLIYRANNIYMIRDSLYYNRYRLGSISRLSLNDRDYWLMNKRKYYELLQVGYPKQKACAHLLGVALRCYGRAANIESEEFSEAKLLIEKTRGIPTELSWKEKGMLMLWRLNKRLYREGYIKMTALLNQ